MKRVRFAAGSDLFGNGLRSWFGRQDFDVDFCRENFRKFGARREGALVTPVPAALVAVTSRTAVSARSTRATVTTRATVVVAWSLAEAATAVASRETLSIASRAASIIARRFALELGVGICSWSFLEPVGEELEVEWERGFFAHDAGWKEGDGMKERLPEGRESWFVEAVRQACSVA